MPSSEEIMDAQFEVEVWYHNYLKEHRKGYPEAAIREIADLTPYHMKLEAFKKVTGAYTGSYSPY